MTPAGHNGGERDSHGPHIVYLAVAVAAAVTVLAGFSYAASKMVGRLADPSPTASAPAYPTPSSVTVSPSDFRGWRASSSTRVPPSRIVVRFTDADSGVLRVRGPAGRRLEIELVGAPEKDPVVFETLKGVVGVESDGDVLSIPPLDSGVYPFSTRSGAAGGVLILE